MMENKKYRNELRKLAIEYSCKYSKYSHLVKDIHLKLKSERKKR